MIGRSPARLALASAVAAALLCATPAPARSQDPPKFEFVKPEEVTADKVEWKASAQAGFVSTTGNSRTLNVIGGGTGSRRSRDNRFSIEASGSYARSSIFIAVDRDGDGFISEDEIEEQVQTTAQAWEVKSRYDRFLTPCDSVYLLAAIGGDRPAGKQLVGGGQLGYSRRVFKDEYHEVIAELGYDFTYENLVAAGKGLAIHSARGFTGYAFTISDKTAAKSSVEVLVNANRLESPAGSIAPGEDTRVNGELELTTKLTSKVTLSASFRARFDNAPAPRPPLPIPYEEGFVPLAERLDTLAKVSVIVSLL
jgi:hypothetical protein